MAHSFSSTSSMPVSSVLTSSATVDAITTDTNYYNNFDNRSNSSFGDSDPVIWPHRLTGRGYIAVAVLLFLVWVGGSVLSLVSLRVFVINKRLWSPTNTIVMCLLFNDFMMSFFGTFPAMVSAWKKRWIFGHAGCVVEGWTVFFLGLSSMYLLTAISLDRYIVIVKPFWGHNITYRVAAASVAVCWLGGFLWAAFPLMGWNEYVLEGAGVSCSVVWESSNPNYTSYIFTIFVFCFLLPLCLIVFCYFNIFLVIHNTAQNRIVRYNERLTRKNILAERRIAKTIAFLLCGFLFCWLPYAVVSFIVVFRGSGVVSAEVATYPAILAKTQGLLNPLLYVATNRRFREAFFKLRYCPWFCKCADKRQENTRKANADTFEMDAVVKDVTNGYLHQFTSQQTQRTTRLTTQCASTRSSAYAARLKEPGIAVIQDIGMQLRHSIVKETETIQCAQLKMVEHVRVRHCVTTEIETHHCSHMNLTELSDAVEKSVCEKSVCENRVCEMNVCLTDIHCSLKHCADSSTTTFGSSAEDIVPSLRISKALSKCDASKQYGAGPQTSNTSTYQKNSKSPNDATQSYKETGVLSKRRQSVLPLDCVNLDTYRGSCSPCIQKTSTSV